MKLGLLDSESVLNNIGEEDVRRCSEALTIYIKDMKEKLSVFDQIAGQTGRLMDILNKRFKYKQLSLHRTQGFQFNSLTGASIEISDLSSGEQHELVLLYELLFRIPEKSLILIDEPEISLHVAWQASFLGDLMGILKSTNSYGVVATHSPTLIGPRWDLTTKLSGPDLPDVEES
jgi:predicted ATP-binding protein involved in virulence